jgi:hypothetical protein
MGRARGGVIERGAKTRGERDARPRAMRALLMGGARGCAPVFVDALSREIAVYQNGGAAFAIGGDEPAPGDAKFLGRYVLVEGHGPETPVYVPAR